jgi:hypothetical protein
VRRAEPAQEAAAARREHGNPGFVLAWASKPLELGGVEMCWTRDAYWSTRGCRLPAMSTRFLMLPGYQALEKEQLTPGCWAAAAAVLWKHTIARQKAKGRYPQPALRIVSFGAEKTNRSPTFDLDLEDLLDPATGEPLSYPAARALFERDPSQRWAAYVAGTVLVLMREKGLRCSDSLAILIHSAVPEGKGVSSSAAVEVSGTSRGDGCVVPLLLHPGQSLGMRKVTCVSSLRMV